MASRTFIYLIVFPEKNVIKVGKADDVKKRFSQLTKWWGDADYTASYALEVDRKHVFKIESALHCMLAGAAVEFEHGDGKTEMFSIGTLDIALKYFELYSSCNDTCRLHNGLPNLNSDHPEDVSGKDAMAYTIRTIRKSFGKTQAEFATSVGIYPRVLMDIERGQGNARLDTLTKIADVIGLEIGFVKPDDRFRCLDE